MIRDLIIIIEKVKVKLIDDSDMLWTSYETAAELKAELEKYVTELTAGNTDYLNNLNMHFLPSSTFQGTFINELLYRRIHEINK